MVRGAPHRCEMPAGGDSRHQARGLPGRPWRRIAAWSTAWPARSVSLPTPAGDCQVQEALLRLPGAVLSHDTALEVEDLADVNPRRIHVTMPPGYRLRRQVPGWITVHRDRLEPAEVTEHQGLEIVTPARAIIDAIEDDLGDRFVEQALATARRRNLLTTPEETRIERVRAIS